MISKIKTTEFWDSLPMEVNPVDRIRIKSILDCYAESSYLRAFSADGAVILLFGKTAFVFGKCEDIPLLMQFLNMSGIQTVSGDLIGIDGEKRVYSVMKTEAEEILEEKPVKISVPAKLMSSVFGYEFDDVYPDLCLRYNKGIMKICTTSEDAAAAIHKTSEGNLLTGVCVKRSKRGKGIGTALVKKAKQCVSGELYVICEPSLEGFYSKSGFIKTGVTIEAELGER